MSTVNPAVSVIIPNYNHARYLPLRIDSVLNQTYRNIEIILMDDCSPDSSRDIIAEYAAKDERIRLVFNKQNSGSTFKQWNKGISLARGEYIWIAESDDYADEHLLNELVGKLETDSTIGLAYCDSWSIDENNQVVGTWEDFYDELDNNLWKNDFILNGKGLVSKFMSFRNIIPNASAVVIRKSLIKQVGLADETFRVNGDWVFWSKILVASKVSFSAKKLNYFRQHTNNVRSSTYFNGTATLESTRVIIALGSLVQFEPFFYDKMINILINRWIDGIIEDNIPFGRHAQLYHNFKLLGKQNISRFRELLAERLLTNRFAGLKNMIRNKVINRIFSASLK